MDVTALLNGNSSAVDQQKKGVETIRLPTRSRTPWDAGGYSLPLNMAAAAVKTPPPSDGRRDSQPLDDDELPTTVPFTPRQVSAAPTSPIHKFTDSRSSLSSFASSSLHSANHSRYSSISTLNSPRALSVSLSEQLQLSPKASDELADISSRQREGCEVQVQPSTQQSPTRSVDTLAQITEYHSSEDVSSTGRHSGGSERRSLSQQPEDTTSQLRPQHSRSISSGGISPIGPVVDVWSRVQTEEQPTRNMVVNESEALGNSVNDITRPSSPSDTLLIKRTTIPTLHLHTQEHHLSVPCFAEPYNGGRTHKRALSAPNFLVMDTRPHRPMAHEPTPPTSNHPEHDSPQSSFQQSPPATPPTTNTTLIHAEPTCMYIDDCDTDSPQRKAISHIFGRNKMCTRMIPERLWVHLCRKHYQRCRYRDANKWAKVQCDLVQIQIRRIHDWSLNSQLDGEGDGIRLQSWSLAMRKREKVRREILATKRKRGDDSEDVEVNESEHPSTQTKVPDWLVDHCGREFSTQGILAIFNRLHQDVLDGHVGPQFPDIELLPNLLLPEDGPAKKITAPKAPKKTHQRSQSLNTHSSHESKFRDHAQKRRRPNEEVLPERILHSLPAPRGGARRPAYPSIREYEETGDHPYSRIDYQQSIVTPQPRRIEGQSTAAHLESGGFRPSGRPAHQRSQSDVSAFSYGRSEYMRSSSSNQISFQFPAHGHREVENQPRSFREINDAPYHGKFEEQERALNNQRHFNPEDREHQLSNPGDGIARYRQYNADLQRSFTGERELPQFGHIRHNSSPAHHQPSQYPAPPQYPNNQQARQSPTPFVPQNERLIGGIPRIRETQETRDLYFARR